MKNKPGRNDNCHCGSGNKFKNCHGKTIGISSQTWVIVAVIFLFLLWFLFFETKPSAEATNYSPSPLIPKKSNLTLPATLPSQTGTSGPKSQPPGDPPPGKVWSVEHGHWHNAPLAPTSLPANPETPKPIAQPPGDPPPGKVWSSEHGHWHDQN